jgi:dolichol-phosphate mannosyltransferase
MSRDAQAKTEVRGNPREHAAGASERVLVTVATYNELENLPRLVDEIHRWTPDADILVIDDNSPDGTGRWVDERAREDQRLHCLHRSGKLGLGTATVAGLRHGLQHGYALVLNLDADFSHHPKYVPALLDAVRGNAGSRADVAIGSRYVPGGGTEGWPWHRRMMSRCVNLYARCLLGLPVKDTSGAFRCYRTELLQRVNYSAIRSRGYSFQEEFLWHLKQAGARFVEVPIVFADRAYGQSKINAKEAITALAIILRLGLRNWFETLRNLLRGPASDA